jgi:hypothetical protein
VRRPAADVRRQAIEGVRAYAGHDPTGSDSSKRFGELEDKPLRSAEVTQQEEPLVVDDVADCVPAGRAHPVDDRAQVVDLEGEMPDAQTIRRCRLAGPPVLRRHRACGKVTQIELRCAQRGEIVTSSDVDVEPGPGMTA